MKKITKKEINERIKTIMLRESHKNEKIIYKEILTDNLYENSFKLIANFKTINDLGFVTVYNIFGYRNEYEELSAYMYSTSTNFDSYISI